MDDRAILIQDAFALDQGGHGAIMANGQVLTTPAGNPVATNTFALADAMAEELVADGVADVTQPCLYAFYSTERDFIQDDPAHTIDALVELLGHDFLVHPNAGLGRRQVQVAAWGPQIALWQRIAGQEPPFAEPNGEPEISRAAYGAFRSFLASFHPAQLSVAMHAANLLKSASLGMLLAERAIDAKAALEAAAVTPRVSTGDTQEDLEAEQEQEEEWQEAIARLLRYAELSSA